VRPLAAGEILIEPGDRVVPFFVITAGSVEIVRPSLTGETLIAVHGPGKFTGEGKHAARPPLAGAGAGGGSRRGDRADARLSC